MNELHSGFLGSNRFARYTKRAGGSLAIAAAFLGTGLVITAVPAYANITSGYYTVGSPSGAVTSVDATPTTVGADASTDFALTFTTSAALAGSSSSWVTVVSSEALGSDPTNVDLIDKTTPNCLQAGTAGEAGSGSVTTSDLTVDLASSCAISAGDSVEVDFDADAPPSISSLTFSVTTSGDLTPAGSNTVSVGTSGATLTAGSVSFGANTTYSISDVPVANLSAAGTSVELAAGITEGTESLVFYNGPSGYSVSYTPSGGSATADPVTGATLGVAGESVTLTLADALVTGDTVNIVATGTNPTASAATESNDISVTPGNGTAEATNSIVFGNQVSSVTVSPSTTAAGSLATYVVNFRTYSAVSSGYIFLSETGGPTDFATVTGVLVSDTSRPWQYVATGSVLSDGFIDIPIEDAIDAGDSITVTLQNVTNPPARSVIDFAVSTSGDIVPLDAPPYTIGAAASTGVTVTLSDSATGAVSTYAISNLVASASMAGGSATITLEGPSGTVFPSVSGYFSIADTTTPSGSGTVTGAVSGGGSNEVTFIVPSTINNGDHFTLTVGDVINPGTASSIETISVLGNVTGYSTSNVSAFPDANSSYPNGAIVSFSGTDYVFAGGHPFEVTSSSLLSKLEKVDHATVLNAVSGASVPTTAPRSGTLVFTRPINGASTIYVVGNDGELHGFATPAQFVGDGYDPALVVTVTSLSGLKVGSTAGKEGASANAFATSADGAIVTSSGAYYVFAGGRAFPVPNPTSLATIKKADKAKALSGSVTSADKTASIASGILVSASGVVYVSYDSELWVFSSLKQLASDGYSGTAGITLPSTGGISVVTSYSGS